MSSKPTRDMGTVAKIDALFTSTSMPPNWSTVRWAIACVDSSLATSEAIGQIAYRYMDAAETSLRNLAAGRFIRVAARENTPDLMTSQFDDFLQRPPRRRPCPLRRQERRPQPRPPRRRSQPGDD